MSFTELIPAVQALPRNDKMRLMQLLASDLANGNEEPIPPLPPAATVWSPYDSHEAAVALAQMLAEENGAS